MKETHELSQGQVIVIDRNMLRGSYNFNVRQSTIHMANAFSVANGVILDLRCDKENNCQSFEPK